MAEQITTSWGELDLTSLVGDEVEGVVETASDVLTVLSAMVELATTAVDAMLLLSQAAPDLLRAALAAFLAALEAAIEFFIATHIGVAYYVPTSFRSAPTPSGLLQLFANSLSDKKDPNRPLGGESNHFVMMVIMGAAPNPRELYVLFKQLGELFNLPLGDPLLERDDSYYKEALGEPPLWPPKTASGTAQAPNWTSQRLADMEPFAGIVQGLLGLRQAFQKTDDELEKLSKLIDLVRRRVLAIQTKVQRLLDLIESILAAASASSGLSVLTLRGEGSVAEQQAALLAAVNHSDFPYAGSPAELLAGGLVFHVQSGDGGVIDGFTSLLKTRATVTALVQEEIGGPLQDADRRFTEIGRDLSEELDDG